MTRDSMISAANNHAPNWTEAGVYSTEAQKQYGLWAASLSLSQRNSVKHIRQVP